LKIPKATSVVANTATKEKNDAHTIDKSKWMRCRIEKHEAVNRNNPGRTTTTQGQMFQKLRASETISDASAKKTKYTSHFN